MDTLRVVMVTGARRIEIEGPQKTVLEKLEEMRAWVEAEGLDGKRPENPDPLQMTSSDRTTLRTFIAAKQPGNVYEAIAVMLAYKKDYEGKPELSADDIRVAMIQAAFRPPKAMGQALADCRRRYGYVEVGSGRGSWRLTGQGETLVELDLPRTKA